MRAAAAEPGLALGPAGRAHRQRTLLGREQVQPRVHSRSDVLRHAEFLQPLGDRLGDQRRVQVGVGAQQPVAAGVGLAPLAARGVVGQFVELAQHIGPHIGPPVVELFLDLVLDDLALFLDHQDLLQALGELARDRGFQRPDHRDLVQPDADGPAAVVVQPQVGQRLAGVVEGFAAGDDAESVVRTFDHVVVEPVGAHIGQRGVPLEVEQPRLLHQRGVGPADVQPARRHREIGRQQDLDAVGRDIDAGRRLDHFLDRLHRGPQTREAAHRERVQPEVKDVLRAGREEHRQPAGFEDVVALVRGGAAFGHMVVACQRDHAAVRRGARHVGVFEHIRAAVNARAFAVPDAEHAVELLVRGVELDLLRAPDRGGRQFLVDTGLEHDVLRRQVFLGGPQRLVIAAQRRAAVAADEAGGVQTHRRIALALQHR